MKNVSANTSNAVKSEQTNVEVSRAVKDLVAKFENLSPEEKKALLKEVKPNKTKSMTRMDAVCKALIEKKPQSIKEWMESSNTLYGSPNDSETKANINTAIKVLDHFAIEHPTK